MTPVDDARGTVRWALPGLVLAWIAILAASAVYAGRGLFHPAKGPGPADEAMTLLRMPAAAYECLDRVVRRERTPTQALDEMQSYDGGGTARRLRFAALVAALRGPGPAGARILDLEARLAAGTLHTGENEAEPLRILRTLYAAPTTKTPGDLVRAVAMLSTADAEALRRELGWFGRLALEPDASYTTAAFARVGDPRPPHRDVGAALSRALLDLLAVTGTLALLLVPLIFAIRGGFVGRLGPPIPDHGVLAESAAIFLLAEVLIPLQSIVPGGLLAYLAASQGFKLLLLAIALSWPRLRGIPLRDALRAAGWGAGRGVGREFLVGLAAFLPFFPLETFLMLLLPPWTGGASWFTVDIASDSAGRRLLAMSSVMIVVPLVEETCYRGLIYRQVREALRGHRPIVGIAAGIGVSGVLFSVGHSGGWSPFGSHLLFSAATVLLFEWRGTLWAPVGLHFASNALSAALNLLRPS